MSETVIHPLDPIWNSKSKILILGTMPSQKSREQSFYYSHPRNRFWEVMQCVLNEQAHSNEERTEMLLRNGIALWDVLKSCEITGSSDASIKNAVANDLNKLIDNSEISKIYTTGKTAYKLYNKLIFNSTGIEAICLPSTSPANAAYNLKMLIHEYKTAILI